MCLFCKIINKEIPSTVVHENDDFLAFRDIEAKAPSHILAVPKKHFDSFETFPSEMMAGLSAFVKETAKIEGLSDDGYRLITNVGENAFQTVKHLHFHIIGGAQLKWPDLV